MCAQLVATTTSGYRKYKTKRGRTFYQDPDGNFTSQNAWAGTVSQGAQIVPEFGGGVGKGKKYYDTREDLGSYKEANDIVYNEPYEDSYIPPQGFPFSGYPVEDYPTEKRLEMMKEDVRENPNHDHYSFAVLTIIYDGDGTILSRGERHTNKLPKDSLVQLEAEFREIISELSAIAVSYGGVAILKSKVKFRDYEQ